MLPESVSSIADLRELEDRMGGLGYLVLVLSGDDPEALERHADRLAGPLEALEQVHYVAHRRPLQWFLDRGLYFLDLEDLETLHRRVKRRVKWEKRRRNPLYIDLEEDDEPPPLDFSDLRGKYERRGTDLTPTREYYRDGRDLAILVKPRGAGTDVAFAKRLVEDVSAIVDAHRAEGIEVRMTGRFKKFPEQNERIRADLVLCSLVALALMLAYIAFHFRRLAAMVLILMPLGLALTWTIALAGVLVGKLNVLTGLVGATLLGLGIDHGIHLLGRYEASQDVQNAFGHTGRAVAIAALTTLSAFGAVAMSEFRAFHEFGLVAGLGMVLAVVSYTTVMPALIGLFERAGWQMESPEIHRSPYARWFAGRSRTLLLGFGVLLAAVVWRIPEASFDVSFRSLEASQLPAFRLDSRANQLIGYSETPLVVLVNDHDAEAAVAAELRRRRDERGARSTVRRIATVADLVPPDQAEKAAVLARLRRQLRKVKDRWVPDEHREHYEDLKRMVRAEPFARSDLPWSLRRQYETRPGNERQGQVLVFPAVDTRDGRKVIELRDESSGIATGAGDRTVSAAGEAMVMAQVLEQLITEVGPVLLLTAGLVVLCLLLLTGTVRDVALCLVPAAATVALTAGLMPYADVQLNYLNVIFLPVLFGIAVDGGVHLVTRLREGDKLADVVEETGRSVCGALLTTALGFGSLLLAEHPGVASVGQLMLLGITTNVLATLVALPALLGTLQR